MGVDRFEDLIAWQKARQLAQRIYRITRNGDFAKDFGLAGQIQRAAVSVVSNIAEGFERTSLQESRHFLSNAKGSCGEVRAQLYVALDLGYVNETVCRQLLSQAEEVSRIISGLHASVGQVKRSQTGVGRL